VNRERRRTGCRGERVVGGQPVKCAKIGWLVASAMNARALATAAAKAGRSDRCEMQRRNTPCRMHSTQALPDAASRYSVWCRIGMGVQLPRSRQDAWVATSGTRNSTAKTRLSTAFCQ